MSTFHGPQSSGAARAHREEKRREAEERNARTTEERKRKGQLGCPSGKTVLFTEKDAQAELVGTLIRRNRGNQKRKECRWYSCDKCGYFHLTSQPLPTNQKEQHHA